MRGRILEKKKYYLRMKSLLPGDHNSMVENSYQFGKIGKEIGCKTLVLCYILREPIFDSLRTQQQLGYAVSISPYQIGNLLGIEVTVKCQENIHSSKYVEEKMEEFLQVTAKKLFAEISEEELETTKQSLCKLILRPVQDLDTEFFRNWSEIHDEKYVFDRQKQVADYAATLSKNDLIEFFEQYLDSANQRKFSIQVVGNIDEPADKENTSKTIELLTDMQASDEVVVIDNIENFRNSLELHEYIKDAF